MEGILVHSADNPSPAGAQPDTHNYLRVALAAATAGMFLLLCLFRGSAVNLAIFAFAWGLLLLALSLISPRGIAVSLVSVREPSVLAVGALGVLVLSYQLSLSKDNSFVPTLALALCPLGFVLARGLGARLQLALVLMSLVVLGFALRSTWLLLGGSEGDPLWPFLDANNYAALIYLVLIPWFHHYLSRLWRGEQVPWAVHAALFALAFLLLVALAGAQSRGATVIFVVALVIWSALGLWHRRSLLPVLALAGVGLAAFFAVEVLSVIDVSGEFGTELVAANYSVRSALLAASLTMLGDGPWFGVGVFVFPLLYRRYRLEGDQDTMGLYAHNDYLQLLIEGGVLALLVLLVFAVGIGWRFLQGVRASPEGERFAQLGVVMALAAALAHAAITFVFYAAFLAIVIGLQAGWLYSKSAASTASASPRLLQLPVIAGLLFGWICWGYLALDTFSAGVFGGQNVPGAAAVRASSDSALRYTRLAAQLNADRGMPAFAQAALLQEQLGANPMSADLRAQTLAAYRRAAAADVWNPRVHYELAQLLERHPDIGPLHAGETPGELLLQALSVDPLFVPAIDDIVERLVNLQGEPAGFAYLAQQVLPWLQRMSRENPDAAVRYFKQLEVWARRYEDAEVLAALARLRGA